jgi:hypothetical protein
LHDRQGDLLVLFWAGHGAINEKEHRLFTADATTADKRNWPWHRLRESFESSFFAGFPRQILIADVCADYRDDFEFTAPGEYLPAGTPMAHEHFVFLATQPGQTAKNLGEERRGLFSRELLKCLGGRSPEWPPDMPAVAAKVKEAFDALRKTGKATQVPRFEWIDWTGDRRDVGPVVPPRVSKSEPKGGTATLDFPQLNGLAMALVACQAMRSESRRNQLLDELRPDIATRALRHSDARSDVMSILRAASAYPGGLSELLQLVQAFEGPSTAWQAVEAYVSGPLAHLGISLEEDA